MSSDEDEIIEHVVLFKVKPDVEASKVAAMVNRLNGLASLNLTIHLSAGQIHSCQSSSSLSFTHILHSRYRSKDHLRTYAVHPDHVRVVTENKPIIDDIMAVDWISTVSPPKPAAAAGSAMRVTFLKLKENLGENEKDKVLDVIKGMKKQFQEFSFGENFSHDRAKGYSIASIAVVPAPADLEALDSSNVNLEKQNVKDFIESVMLIDYVCGSFHL